MKKQITLLSILSVVAYANCQDGALDLNFNANGTAYVRSIEKLADGRVLIAHSQGAYGGLKVFNADGSDAAQPFTPVPAQTEFSNNWINDILQQADGKVILLGSSGFVKIARYNTDGSQDAQFQANVGTGANMTIKKGLLDADGKIVLIGDFTSFNNVPKSGIVRLNQDGTIDNSFVTTTQNSILRDICHNENGGYYLAGLINGVNGQYTYNETVKLHPNGEIDTTFNAYTGSLELIAIAPDHSVIGVSKTQIFRFQLTGAETPFAAISAGSSQATPVGLHIQNDGKIILTGSINNHYYNGQTTAVNNVFRINADGSHDATFNPGAGPSNGILCSQLTNDGALLVAGLFWQFDGQSRNYLARLINSGLPYYPGNQSADLNEVESSIQLKLFPNPATDVLFFESNETIVSVTLWSMDGKQVMNERGISIQNISLTGLSKGIYNLRLISESGKIIQRRIIKE